jgi:hypothetical protein
MHAFKSIVAFIIAVLILGSTSVSARIVPSWPYGKLWDAADVVVIIEPLKTENNEDKFQIPWDPEGKWQGLTTHFKIHGVFKGGPLSGEIILKHFDFKPEILLKTTVFTDWPSFIRFTPGPLRYDETISKGEKTVRHLSVLNQIPMFLAFLKRSSDGTFIPVTGQVDPSFSFKELREVFFSPAEN